MESEAVAAAGLQVDQGSGADRAQWEQVLSLVAGADWLPYQFQIHLELFAIQIKKIFLPFHPVLSWCCVM